MILFSCRRAAELTSKALDAPLDPDERLGLAAHRAICSACRRYRVQLVEMDAAVAALVNELELDHTVSLSDEAKGRLRQAVRASASAGGEPS